MEFEKFTKKWMSEEQMMKQDLNYSKKITSYVIHIGIRLFSKTFLGVSLQHTSTKIVYFFFSIAE